MANIFESGKVKRKYVGNWFYNLYFSHIYYRMTDNKVKNSKAKKSNVKKHRGGYTLIGGDLISLGYKESIKLQELYNIFHTELLNMVSRSKTVTTAESSIRLRADLDKLYIKMIQTVNSVRNINKQMIDISKKTIQLQAKNSPKLKKTSSPYTTPIQV